LLKEGIHINQTIAAGDGVMILPMLNLAGLGPFTLNLQLSKCRTSISSLIYVFYTTGIS
jgi:hypothetical protein